MSTPCMCRASVLGSGSGVFRYSCSSAHRRSPTSITSRQPASRKRHESLPGRSRSSPSCARLIAETEKPASRKCSITSMMIVVLPAPDRPTKPKRAGPSRKSSVTATHWSWTRGHRSSESIDGHRDPRSACGASPLRQSRGAGSQGGRRPGSGRRRIAGGCASSTPWVIAQDSVQANTATPRPRATGGRVDPRGDWRSPPRSPRSGPAPRRA